jgi:hypothetical protein
MRRILAALVLTVGCSSPTQSSAQCGEGTVLVDGVCVVEDAGVEPDTSTDASVPVDTSVPDTTTKPDTITSDIADTKTSDASWDAAGPEPCPTKVDYNCSSTCGADTCGPLTCESPTTITFATSMPRPIVIRTPDRPEPNANCHCTGAMPVTSYSLHFQLYIAGTIRIRVAPPWKIYRANSSKPLCAASEYGQCAVLTNANQYILIGTTTPTSSPSRNVIIEDKPLGEGCP